MIKLQRNPDLCRTHTEDGRPILFLLDSPSEALPIDPELERLVDCFDLTPRSVEEVIERVVSRGAEVSAHWVTDAIELLRRHRILVSDVAQASLYDDRMAPSYKTHRAVPIEISDAIAAQASVGQDTFVLDIATGTGSLALALSRYSKHVTGIDVSEPLLACARDEARRVGSDATFMRRNAAQLMFSLEQYHLATLCQAFHWLDPGLAVHGLYRVVADDGSLYMIESKYGLPKQHPMRRYLGFGTPVGQPMAKHCYSHALRYHLLFEWMRKHPPFLRLTGLTLFRQLRRFEFGFARAFFFDQQVKSSFPGVADPWAALEEAYAATAPEHLHGKVYWFAARYQKRPPSEPLFGVPNSPQWIDIPVRATRECDPGEPLPAVSRHSPT
jgi:ubiquinone/menaquinone biosynthesis C-methylase UbiE